MILSYFQLLRLYYSLPFTFGFFVIVSYLRGGNFDFLNFRFLFSMFSVFTVISGSYVLNDYVDIEIDKINKPDKPLPKKKIERKHALYFSFILYLMSIISASFCGFPFFLLLTSVVVLSAIYNFFSKNMNLLKDIYAAVLMVSLYPLSFSLFEAADSPRVSSLFFFAIWLFLTSIGYEMLKDKRDLKGDAAFIKNNYRVYASWKFFGISAKLLIVSALSFAFLPYALGYCKVLYLVFFAAAAAVLLTGLKLTTVKTISCVYIEVSLITAGSFIDLLVFA